MDVLAGMFSSRHFKNAKIPKSFEIPHLHKD